MNASLLAAAPTAHVAGDLLRFRRSETEQNLAGALGMIDGVVIAEVWGAVDGWLLHPDHVIDEVRVRLNGEVLGTAGIDPRPDVAKSFPTVPHAACSRYLAQGPVRDLQGKPLYLEAIGLVGGREVVRTEDYWPGEDTHGIATPDEVLRERVSGKRDAENFGCRATASPGNCWARCANSCPASPARACSTGAAAPAAPPASCTCSAPRSR